MKVGTQLFHESVYKICKEGAKRDKRDDSYMTDGNLTVDIHRI